VWDAATGQAVRTLEGHEDGVNAVAWSADGRWLASSSHDKTVRVWDAATGWEVQRIDGEGDVRAVAASLANTATAPTKHGTPRHRFLAIVRVGDTGIEPIQPPHPAVQPMAPIAWFPGLVELAPHPSGLLWAGGLAAASSHVVLLALEPYWTEWVQANGGVALP
jgi:hypothetical protein